MQTHCATSPAKAGPRNKVVNAPDDFRLSPTHVRTPSPSVTRSADILPRRKNCTDPFAVLDRVRAREILADEIERMIAILDAIDADPDLEETGDDEPNLGHYSGSAAKADLEQDTSDDEPSIGAVGCLNQEHWAGGDPFFASVDRELDPSNDEHSLGWSNPLGAKLDARCQLIVERAPDRQVRP